MAGLEIGKAKLKFRIGSLAREITRPIVAGVVLASLFQVLAWIPIFHHDRPGAQFLAEQVREFGIVDTSWQRHVYQAVIAALLVLTTLRLFPVPVNPLRAPLTLQRSPANKTLANMVFAALIGFGLFFQDISKVYVISGLGIALGASYLLRAAVPSKKVMRVLVGSGTIAMVLVLIVPGLFMRARAATAVAAVSVGSHYGYVLGPMIKIGLGTSFDQLGLNYGAFPIVASGLLFTKHVQFRDLFNVVMFFQVLFMILLFVAANLYDKSKTLLFPAFIAILVAPFAATFYPSMYYPNHAGIRYLGLLIGVILLRLSRAGVKEGLWQGLAASLLVFYNPETGIPVCLGIAFRQIIGGLSVVRRIQGAIGYFLTFLVGLGIGCAILYVLMFHVAGIPSENFFRCIILASSGYGGLAFHPDPWAFLMVLCGTAVMLHAAGRAAQGLLTDAQGTRAAIGAILLVSLLYWVNRPQHWNLWTLNMLLLFAAADWITVRRWRAAIEWLRRGRLTVAVSVMVGVAAPLALQNLKDTRRFLFPAALPTAMFSSISIPEDVQSELTEKSSEVRALAANHKLVYISIVSTFVALDSGVPSGLRQGDVFLDTISAADLHDVVAEVMSRSPDLVLFDAQDGKISRLFPNRTELLNRIRLLLDQTYVATRTERGWEVWVPRPPPLRPPAT